MKANLCVRSVGIEYNFLDNWQAQVQVQIGNPIYVMRCESLLYSPFGGPSQRQMLFTNT